MIGKFSFIFYDFVILIKFFIIKSSNLDLQRISGATTNTIFSCFYKEKSVSKTDVTLENNLNKLHDDRPILKYKMSNKSEESFGQPQKKIEENKKQIPRKCLLRIYGYNVDSLFSREVEIYWFKVLSQKKFGPRLYSLFGKNHV